MSTQNEKDHPAETPIFDPFPEPNTMPSGWDLTGIAPSSAPEPEPSPEETPED